MAIWADSEAWLATESWNQSSSPDGQSIQLVREWDTGTGPLVGRPLTAVNSTKTSAGVGTMLDFVEGQAGVANTGLAVQAVVGGVRRGFWFDLTGSGPGVYREEPSGTLRDRATLLALIGASDLMVFHATALGSERTTAWPSSTGAPAVLTGGSPSSLTLEPMAPDTFWQDVPLLTGNWDPNAASQPFVWTSATLPTPPFPQKVRILQHGILNDGAGLSLGLPRLRHDAPRRFRVAGDNFRHGARMVLRVPANPSSPTTEPFTAIALDLHPTSATNTSGKRIWVTHAEMEPLLYYVLLLGGPVAPGVASVLDAPSRPSRRR